MSKSKISEKQLIANQQNCQKSTGPKTDEGKQIASRNSIKHGLHSKDIIINSPHLKESRDEYEALVQSFYDELEPTTSAQITMVRKIANCFWRSRRAIIAETAIINRQLNSLKNNSYYNDLTDQLDEIPELPPDPNYHDDMQEMRAEIAQSRSNLVGAKIIPQFVQGANILYYEMRLDKQLSRYYRIYRSLERRQERKQKKSNKKVPSGKGS